MICIDLVKRYSINYLQWSYGVTLWELMTRGVRPYAAVDNWDMERFLKSGRRLPQPLYCPTQLYVLFHFRLAHH